ncbi:uncharacterized protein LOC112639686 [Camponotus floridanus]|uniref:uncharacterized protein LOC112639686 n=1 Tax=Camponotus floridanus TaxID=104421 RepID=UPI000DC6978B|nr:uncharacterized protein LOC112639686 [Camponotus floridanus]
MRGVRFSWIRAYPVRPVKAHFKKEHATPRGRAGRSTDGANNSNNNVNYDGSSANARGRPAAGSAPGSSASAGASSRGRPSDSRQPGLRSTAPAPGTTAATPPATTTASTPATPPARTSPSYAAVTAAPGPSTCGTSSSAATTATTTAAVTGGTAAILDGATAGAPAAATTGLKAHPQRKGRLPLKRGAANRKSSPLASREARGSPRRPSGEANGPLRRTSVTSPTIISSARSRYDPRIRRSSGVPLEKSGATRSTRRPPLPSPESADDTPTFGGRGARGEGRPRGPRQTSSGRGLAPGLGRAHRPRSAQRRRGHRPDHRPIAHRGGPEEHWKRRGEAQGPSRHPPPEEPAPRCAT